jgi:hypothetical protein
LDLSFKIGLLGMRRHSAIADDSALTFDGSDAEERLDIVPALTACGPESADASFVCVFSKSVCMES